MRRLPSLTVAVLAACVAAACASGTRTGEPRRSDLITREEIERAGAITALDAVERLRPHFLRERGGTSLRDRETQYPPQVFVDGMELGGPEMLRDIPASSVLEIRYEPNRVTETRLGSGQYGGVIHVRTGQPTVVPPAGRD